MIFAPDDFHNDPYTAGLNQIGHIGFGAALCLVFGVWVAAIAFVAWEVFQLRVMGARKHDYFQDCFFWGAGVFMTGWYWLPVATVLMGGAWMGAVWLYQKLQ